MKKFIANNLSQSYNYDVILVFVRAFRRRRNLFDLSNRSVDDRLLHGRSFLPLLQAFLEMADEGAATTMVSYYNSGMAQLRGRAVYVQFSNHRELKTDQTHSNNAVSSPTNDVANTSEVCVILLASLLSTNPGEQLHEPLRSIFR